MMRPSFVPDFDTYNSMYFPDGEVIPDLAIAKRVDGEKLKNHLEFNGKQSIVPMRQFDDEDLQNVSVPRSVRTPVEMRQYLISLRKDMESQREVAQYKKMQSNLLKFIND